MDDAPNAFFVGPDGIELGARNRRLDDLCVHTVEINKAIVFVLLAERHEHKTKRFHMPQ